MLEKDPRTHYVFRAAPAISRVLWRLWSSVGGTAERSSRLSANPGISDYESIGLVWRPYVMRLCRPHQRTPSVATDSAGFRISRYRGNQMAYDEYRKSVDSSVLLGNSAAFGVGASSDDSSLANQLSLITDRPWYNLSGRASNMMQDVLSLVLYGAQTHQNIVMMSGVNDLLFALHFKSSTPYLPTFWGNDRFAALNASDRVAFRDDSVSSPVEERYLLALEGIERAVVILARYGRQHLTRILFALQPLLAWVEKPLHPNEQAVCSEWDAISSGFRATHRPETIMPWKHRFARDVRMLCEKHGLDFIDLNTQQELESGEHLFVDRIHLTDRGQRLVADLLSRWVRDIGPERPIAGTADRSVE